MYNIIKTRQCMGFRPIVGLPGGPWQETSCRLCRYFSSKNCGRHAFAVPELI